LALALVARAISFHVDENTPSSCERLFQEIEQRCPVAGDAAGLRDVAAGIDILGAPFSNEEVPQIIAGTQVS
jgi:hypothetical protein